MQHLQQLVSNMFCTLPFKNGTVVKQSGDGISSCSIMKLTKGMLKRHKTQVTFWREVFWYKTLSGTGLLPKLIAIDPRELVLLIEWIDQRELTISTQPSLECTSSFRALDRYGVRHNQEHARHILHTQHGHTFIVDWQFATWSDNPSFSLGFMPCEISCPWHGTAPCIATSNDVYVSTGKRCVLNTNKIPVTCKNKRVAVLWKGTIRSNVKKGSHATGYTPHTSNDANEMYVDAMHPILLGKSTHAIRKSQADLFIHGWVTDGCNIETETEDIVNVLALNKIHVKNINLEHVGKSFDKEFGQLLLGDRPAYEASEHPSREYVLLKRESLQRWWSTWYTFHRAFSLLDSHVSDNYDIVVVHRPDMIIPDDLDYHTLDSNALTILMQQDPNNYHEERVGYHDWFLAGSPDIIKTIAEIYENLYDIFDRATHPEERSSHTLLRKLCEEKCIRVHCLHYTNVQKIHFKDKTLSAPVLSSVQTHCRMNIGCIERERKASIKDVFTVTVQGMLCLTIAMNCIKYVPGVFLVEFCEKSIQTSLIDTTRPCIIFHVSTLENFDVNILLLFIQSWITKSYPSNSTLTDPFLQKESCFIKIQSKRTKHTEVFICDK